MGLCYMDADQQLETLKWLKGHGFILNISYVILYVATKKRYSQNFEWLFNNYPEKIARNSHAWELAARCGHHNIYKLLLENYPNQHQKENMLSDFCWAAENGHLKVVKLILDKLNPRFSIHRETTRDQESELFKPSCFRVSPKIGGGPIIKNPIKPR